MGLVRPGRLLACAVAPLALAACAGAGDALRGTGPRVVDVEVEGNEALSDSAILGKLAVRDTGGFLGLGTHQRLDRAALSQDVRRVEDVYEEAGYYGARASARIVPDDPAAEEVTVLFDVREGPPTRVRSLLVEGLADLPPRVRGEVLDGAPLVEGDRFTDEAWEALKAQIRTRLRALGHAEARVDGGVAVSPEEGAADAVLVVEAGLSYDFGEVRVVGNLLVPDEEILQAIDPAFDTGERYSPEKLAEAQGDVLSLGVFSAATVTPADPDPETRTVPVLVAVEEADFLRFRLGAGVGIDQNRQQARILADFSHLNLLGGLQQLRWQNELAWRALPTVFDRQVSGLAGSSEVSLTQPDLLFGRVDLAVQAGYERDLTLAYRSEAVSGRIGFPIRIRGWLFFTPSYTLTRYFDVQIFDEDELLDAAGQRPSLLLTCPDPSCLLTLSFLEQRFAADRRDDPIEPRQGWYASLGLQEGGGILGGDFGWIRVTPDVRAYFPLSRDLVLALRLEVGWLNPLGTSDESPIVVRFFGGGPAGFRGVGTDRLSPQFRTSDGDLIPLGGNSSLLATSELRWYFGETLSSAFFVDLGDVEPEPLGVFESPEPQVAVGAGIRYRTPIGPARLDVGYRVLREPTIPVNSPDPVEESAFDYFALFISIGEAF